MSTVPSAFEVLETLEQTTIAFGHPGSRPHEANRLIASRFLDKLEGEVAERLTAGSKVGLWVDDAWDTLDLICHYIPDGTGRDTLRERAYDILAQLTALTPRGSSRKASSA